MLNMTAQKGAMTVAQTIDNESPKQMISAKKSTQVDSFSGAER